ncbi:PREDICTED: protein trichome birefringence-like 12 [Nelumbo nucifera]|uniref:Protein trichome birefringence-like 12 n=1 Tax=Nelumbo nucifera TaxID=4432 RepID=A0A1U8A0R8_NELNU|nr:PREDICTED: protein trichome birefringence-like 12 [Nelumbo nucifera]
MMASKLSPAFFTWFILLTCLFFFYLYSSFLPFYSLSPTPMQSLKSPLKESQKNPQLERRHPSPICNLFRGHWVRDPSYRPIYDENCPFHRNAWNCLRNKRDNMEEINSWRWVPENCTSTRIDPVAFLDLMRNKKIGFIGDSLNENFLVSFLCILRVADEGAKKWKRKGAWRGGYFPKFNVTVAYHRAVLLAKYEWHPEKQLNLTGQDRLKGIYRVDVDIPADDWVEVTKFYDVLIFNTGHWWGFDKFPKETPLVFYKNGHPILPPLGILDGLQTVLESMVSYIQREVPYGTLKFWRLQSPRHFYGGEWNQNGSCLFNKPLEEDQLDTWFDPRNSGFNKEARQVNHLIEKALQDTDIQLLDLTHLSEFRVDAHPAIWLGKKDAVAIWGQDCMHWCLPGVPDTWVDILSAMIHRGLEIV